MSRRNCFIKEIDQNKLISNKQKKVGTTLKKKKLSYLTSAVTGCF